MTAHRIFFVSLLFRLRSCVCIHIVVLSNGGICTINATIFIHGFRITIFIHGSRINLSSRSFHINWNMVKFFYDVSIDYCTLTWECFASQDLLQYCKLEILLFIRIAMVKDHAGLAIPQRSTLFRGGVAENAEPTLPPPRSGCFAQKPSDFIAIVTQPSIPTSLRKHVHIFFK